MKTAAYRSHVLTMVCCTGTVALLGTACPFLSQTPEDTPVVTQVQATQSTGTVLGQVYEFSSGSPSSGATVRLLADSLESTTQTDTDGLFRFEQVPAGGTASLLITKPGFEPARISVALVNAAGNFPTQSATFFAGPVSLLMHRAAPLTVHVVLPDATDANGANVFLDLPVAYVAENGSGDPVARGSVHRAAAAGTDGVASFVEVPEFLQLATRFPQMELTLSVGAIAGSNAGGVVRSWKLGELLTLGEDLQLVMVPLASSDPLHVAASTLPDLVFGRQVQTPGTVDSSGDPGMIRVVFNRPVLVPSLEATLVNEDGGVTGAVPSRLTFRLPGGADLGTDPVSAVEIVLLNLLAGAEYNLLLTAAPSGGGATLVLGRPLYVSAPDATSVMTFRQTSVQVPNGVLDELEDFELLLSTAVGGRKANGNAATAAEFRPILLTLSYGSVTTRVDGRLSEPAVPSPYIAGGFTTRITAQMPPGASSINTVVDVGIRVDFNDSAVRNGVSNRGGSTTVVTPTGMVIQSAQGQTSVTLLSNDTP